MESKKIEQEAMSSLLERHLEAVNELDPAKQKRLIEETYTPDVDFVDPFFVVRGPEKLAGVLNGLHEKFPGFQFKALGKTDFHHGAARLHWVHVSPGKETSTGHDFVMVKDGKINGIYVFIDGFEYES